MKRKKDMWVGVEKMNCHECNGACCKYIVVHCPKEDRLQYAITKLRGTDIGDGEFIMPCRCRWLSKDTNLCIYYKNRPAKCRLFKPGTRLCLACRKQEGFKEQ